METLLSNPQTAPYPSASVSFAATHQFKKLFTDYLAQDPRLASVAFPTPKLPTLAALASQKNYTATTRQLLIEALELEYKGIGIEPSQVSGLQKLAQPNTYTVTTGHQLCMYLGPLYTVLKAATIIRLAQQTETAYPHLRVVPVFWLASEDHDLDEVSHITLEGQSYHWAIQGMGPAGKQPLQGLKEALAHIWPRLPNYLETYTQFDNLAKAQTWLLHTLLGNHGLVVLDPDVRPLKKLFTPIVLRELQEGFVQPAVQAATHRIEQEGYKGQIAARETNLFLQTATARERLIKGAQNTWTAGGLGTFSDTELLALAHSEPERFSPNVTMRPLYQEMILPNLAYVGGPAEVAYWLQLHDVFEQAGVSMPAVWPRAHALVVTEKERSKLAKLGLQPADLFAPLAAIKNQVLAAKGTNPPDTSGLQTKIEAYLQELEQLTLAQDPALAQAAAAEKVRFVKATAPGLRRVRKAYEHRHAFLTKQVEQLYTNLFPKGGLQERTESYLSFALQDPHFIDRLLLSIDATSLAMHLVYMPSYDQGPSA